VESTFEQKGYGTGLTYEIDSLALIQSIRTGLREFAPLCLAAVDMQLKSAGEVVTQEASAAILFRQRTHGTHHIRSAESYSVQVRADRIRLITRARGAAIIEFAAQGKTPQGRALVDTLEMRYGKPGRVLWEAWDRHADRVTARIQGVVLNAQKALQSVIENRRVA